MVTCTELHSLPRFRQMLQNWSESSPQCKCTMIQSTLQKQPKNLKAKEWYSFVVEIVIWAKYSLTTQLVQMYSTEHKIGPLLSLHEYKSEVQASLPYRGHFIAQWKFWKPPFLMNCTMKAHFSNIPWLSKTQTEGKTTKAQGRLQVWHMKPL